MLTRWSAIGVAMAVCLGGCGGGHRAAVDAGADAPAFDAGVDAGLACDPGLADCNGVATDGCECTFVAAAPMAAARYYHTATKLMDGRVLVAGGFDMDNAPLASAEIYDPTSDAWTPAGDMTVARATHSAVRLSDGRVLVMGGDSETAELYDPTSNAWTATGSMAVSRYQQAAAPLPDGRILVTGGGSPTAEVYDPSSGSWSSAGTMSTDRSSFFLLPLTDGGAIAVGGYYHSTSPSTTLASTEIYDPSTNSWSAGPSMAVARYDFTALRLVDGSILVAGGYGAADAPTTAERLDPPAMAWSAVGSDVYVGEEAFSALRGDGTVLLGGAGGSTEIFDPAAPVFRSGPSLSVTRLAATATSLDDGSVLVVGGGSNDAGAMTYASAEILR